MIMNRTVRFRGY